MNIEKKREHAYHYSFHIMDPAFGHLIIKMPGHPPFGAQVILNGHEYVACAAHAAGIGFVKEGNCFTGITDPAGLAQIAETLSQDAAAGRLGQVCDRWIYTACLVFGLDLADQQASGFRYAYSVYQAEYSRNQPAAACQPLTCPLPFFGLPGLPPWGRRTASRSSTAPQAGAST